jgi:hypothetical protein
MYVIIPVIFISVDCHVCRAESTETRPHVARGHGGEEDYPRCGAEDENRAKQAPRRMAQGTGTSLLLL